MIKKKSGAKTSPIRHLGKVDVTEINGQKDMFIKSFLKS